MITMKKLYPALSVFFMLLIAGFSFAAPSSSPPSQSHLAHSLNQLQDSSRNMLMFTAILSLFGALIFLVCAFLIYSTKIKGVPAESRNQLWMVALVITGGLGVVFVFGAIFSFISYFLTGPLINSLAPTPY